MYTHDFCSVKSLVNYSHFHCSAAVRIASSTLIFNHFHINTERCRERAGEVEWPAPQYWACPVQCRVGIPSCPLLLLPEANAAGSAQLHGQLWGRYGVARVQFGHEAFELSRSPSAKGVQDPPVHQGKPGGGRGGEGRVQPHS